MSCFSFSLSLSLCLFLLFHDFLIISFSFSPPLQTVPLILFPPFLLPHSLLQYFQYHDLAISFFFSIFLPSPLLPLLPFTPFSPLSLFSSASKMLSSFIFLFLVFFLPLSSQSYLTPFPSFMTPKLLFFLSSSSFSSSSRYSPLLHLTLSLPHPLYLFLSSPSSLSFLSLPSSFTTPKPLASYSPRFLFFHSVSTLLFSTSFSLFCSSPSCALFLVVLFLIPLNTLSPYSLLLSFLIPSSHKPSRSHASLRVSNHVCKNSEVGE